MLAPIVAERTLCVVRKPFLAVPVVLLPLLSGCSKTTTVKERFDPSAPGRSSVEVEERWGLPGPVGDLLGKIGRLAQFYVESLFLRHGVVPFLLALVWVVVVVGSWIERVMRDVDDQS
jgi:hypothetical protein